MKIAILTFHRALNYGAVLQTYALQKTLKTLDKNNDIDILDYYAPFLEKINGIKGQISKNPLKSVLKICNVLIRKRKFQRFVKENIQVSKKKYTVKNIGESATLYDAFIVGSDQVWNTHITGNDINYLLAFCDAKKRNSYSASLGIETISEEIKEKYISLLNSYINISVRERTAIQSLQEFGVSLPMQTHIDPALLLGREIWLDMIKNIPQRKKPYVLVFEVRRCRELIEQAEIFSKEKGIDIIYIGPYISKTKVKYIPSPPIKKLLAYFRDAQFVFTNSFHGTVLSVQFQKQFYSYASGEKASNSRISDLLCMLQLLSRMEIENIEYTMDWNFIESILDVERKKSNEYLSGIINKN